MPDSPTMEHSRWRGNNAPGLRGSFRNVKYRSMDAISRKPMARASIFFSPETASPNGVLAGLPGITRKGSQFALRSPFLQREMDLGIDPVGDDKKPPSRGLNRSTSSIRFTDARMNSIGSSSPLSYQESRSALPLQSSVFGASSSNRPMAAASNDSLTQSALQPTTGNRTPLFGERSMPRVSSPPVSMQEVTRLCPTPSAGTGITSAVLELSQFGACVTASATFALPSLTTDPMLRRAATPVCKGKTSIARLIAANRAFVGFEEAPIEDPHRAASSLM